MKFKLQAINMQELGQRANQEDSLFPALNQCTDNDRLFIVCDGMGGHEKGEVASAAVCKAMSRYLLQRWTPDQPLSDDMLRDAVNAAFDELDTLDNGEARKMGTTMTFLCFHADGVTVAHIGDSRVYQLRPATGNQPAQLVFKTRDHSLVNDLVTIGEITEEEALNHPQKNVITRAMQPKQENRARADIKHLDVKPGDILYMCTDGMVEQMTHDNVLRTLTLNKTNEELVEILRNITVDNHDNHTAYIVRVLKVEGAPLTQPATTAPAMAGRTPERSYPYGGPAEQGRMPGNASLDATGAKQGNSDSVMGMPRKTVMGIIVALCVVLVAGGVYLGKTLFGKEDIPTAEETPVSTEQPIDTPAPSGIENVTIDETAPEPTAPTGNGGTTTTTAAPAQQNANNTPQTAPQNPATDIKAAPTTPTQDKADANQAAQERKDEIMNKAKAGIGKGTETQPAKKEEKKPETKPEGGNPAGAGEGA